MKTQSMKTCFVLLIAALMGMIIARADVLELKDGSVLNGRFLGSTAESMRFKIGTTEMTFPVADVLALTLSAPAESTPAPASAPADATTITVPAGINLMVRMTDAVSTRNSAGRRFAARLETDLRVGDVVVAPAGSRLFGRVEEARQGGRMVGSSNLEIGLNEIEIQGKRHSIVTSDFRVRAGNSTGNTLVNTGVGAGIGAAFGGGRGAGRGAAVGAGASALSQADTATIAAGELIEFRLLEPLMVPAPR
jgi:hypothetical protein